MFNHVFLMTANPGQETGLKMRKVELSLPLADQTE